jgi:hypothetical protein
MREFMGMPVYESDLCTKREETQNRTHRKKRINKKYRKLFGVTVKETPCVIMFQPPSMFGMGRKSIAVHPSVVQALYHRS